MSMKYSNDTIGNRTCDLLAFSAVPHLTASPRAPIIFYILLNSQVFFMHLFLKLLILQFSIFVPEPQNTLFNSIQ